MEETTAPAEEVIVTDRSVENPWVVETIGRGGVMLDIGCLGSEYLGEMAARADRACGLDIREVPPVEGVQIVRGDVANPPLKPGSFDVIVSISTIEHIGCAFYGQIPSQDADLIAMRQIRRLLRDNGRALISVPYGRSATYAWFRVYNARRFKRLLRGFRPVRINYYRRDGNRYVRCTAAEIADVGFDLEGFRSEGVVLAEIAKGPLIPNIFALRRLLQRGLGKLLGKS